MSKKLFRAIYEVHGIVSANWLCQAENMAKKTAKNNRWMLKKVVEDNPEEDESFNYPDCVQKLIEEERRDKRRRL